MTQFRARAMRYGIDFVLIAGIAGALGGCSAYSEVPGAEQAHIAAFVNAKAQPGPKATLTVSISGLQPNVGDVRIGLYDSSLPFPKEGRHLEDRVVRVGPGEKMSVEFANLPPGNYAVAAIYDRNRDGKLNTNVLGMPTEPVAFSSGAKAHTFGPPSFGEAQFELKRPTTVDLAF